AQSNYRRRRRRRKPYLFHRPLFRDSPRQNILHSNHFASPSRSLLVLHSFYFFRSAHLRRQTKRHPTSRTHSQKKTAGPRLRTLDHIRDHRLRRSQQKETRPISQFLNQV